MLAAEGLEPARKEANFGWIGHRAAREKAAQQDLRLFALAHVFEEKDVHLPRPAGCSVRSCSNLTGVPQCERIVVQPVPCNDCRVSEPAPAPVGIGKECAIHEIEHDALTPAVGHL
jgi:hypothetical protein